MATKIEQEHATLLDDGDDGNRVMSLIDHLEELRWRIFKVLIAIVVGAIIAFIFRDQIMDFLRAPLPTQANALDRQGDNKLVVMGLTEGFSVTLLVSLVTGLVLALPILLYQTWAFISPGLYAREKKYALPFISLGIVLFLIGISLGYIVLRYPVEWLVSFGSANFTELVTASSYFSFVAIFILVFGLVFELPLVLTFMAKVGIVSGETLRKKRSIAHVVMWIASCFLTPGADIYSPLIIGVSLSLLYELTIIFIRFTIKDEIIAE
ncbi:twin-arginine translocase subunit TatC [Tengunoibacter tsumagoiensis]|uniref:Sec-independent protein translocase protein TatC n=1 Tax=Tengunoibacter tsumagoiensis TaxID=2014871 RepID=A0A402A4K1_9CHLR|nr:twin-arginine translocase subunit TatC [Tengunoibacter tsumagoiensis]GCE13986.1 Sec-independent protein translocase protein TatC [Tengunoibacter tsumagoiensis]